MLRVVGNSSTKSKPCGLYNKKLNKGGVECVEVILFTIIQGLFLNYFTKNSVWLNE